MRVSPRQKKLLQLGSRKETISVKRLTYPTTQQIQKNSSERGEYMGNKSLLSWLLFCGEKRKNHNLSIFVESGGTISLIGDIFPTLDKPKNAMIFNKFLENSGDIPMLEVLRYLLHPLRSTTPMYRCTNCEYQSRIKLGKCPNCGQFGTFVHKQEDDSLTSKHKGLTTLSKSIAQSQRILYPLSNKEVKGVIGEGFVADGCYLLAGEPGIGKSTFALQLLHDILRENSQLRWGYFSGEETADQVVARYTRLYPKEGPYSDFFYATNLESIKEAIIKFEYKFVIIDSIQTISSLNHEGSAGSVGQVRYCAEVLNNLSKEHHVTILVIGHVNKGGDIAGPKYLEHIVDVVLYLEGNRTGELRFLRNYKNRFGHADGTGIFEMRGTGLQPVYDPNSLYQSQPKSPGIAWTVGLDNGRPVLVRIETLLTKSYNQYPTRNYVGVASKRVDMIIAILEKYLGCKLSMMNIFLNIPGEYHFNDSGLDLAIAMAIYSAYQGQKLSDQTVRIGELGLTGRIAKTRAHNKRVAEVLKGRTIVDYTSQQDIVQLK